MARSDVWTREQLIMALNVYCKIPFKDVKEDHPIIKQNAPLIGRSATALKMKIGNFGRFDPVLKAKGIVGLANGSKSDETIWNDFWSNPESLSYESEKLFAERAGKTIEEYENIDAIQLPKGEEREAVVRQRVNQQFFRTAVLCSYLHQCCITGITNSSLLEACHISSWKTDEQNRTNPKNGLCMNALFHKAYDKYLMAITPDHEIIISDLMIEGTHDEQFKHYLVGLQHKKITMPEKFSPNADLLAMHYDEFKRQART